MGGHASAVLGTASDIELCGLDRDEDAMALARQRLAPFGDRAHIFHCNYSNFSDALAELGWNKVDGALLDIGVYALSFVRWFFSSSPTEVLSQVKFAPTGVDESAGILLKNKEEEMATVLLSLHAKQPKRGTISFEKGYVEIFDYPRGEEAVITYNQDGRKEVLSAGSTAQALRYEVEDMERTVSGEGDEMYMAYTRDVMELMTKIRRDWGMRYPEEEV